VNPPVGDWPGRRVWIIGASTGIGAALARELASKGARVALSARSRDKLKTVAGSCTDALVLPADITDAAGFARALEQIMLTWGGIDLVVFAAGTFEPVRAWELTNDGARRTFETNLFGIVGGVATVLPHLLRQGGGAIALIASVAGYRGLPKSLVYGATKAALINFAETLHLDLAPKGISVFLICPGFVATPLTAKNEFRMPALITAEQAGRHIRQGLERGGFEIHFPKRFTLAMKLLRVLPYRLYFPLVRRFTGL
jgi:NAD(P)-dependent dehydrogenase (short-subunit alcohol dehydrogenase family)